jgi:hypothetical protein
MPDPLGLRPVPEMCSICKEVDSMTVTVLVLQSDGQYSASLVGSSTLHVVRPSRIEAIAALERELAEKVATGELMDLEVRPVGVSGLSGTFRDDDTLREICEEIYHQRDAERPQ